MTNLNYQGIQLGSAVDAQLKTLHIDLWSANPGTVSCSWSHRAPRQR